MVACFASSHGPVGSLHLALDTSPIRSVLGFISYMSGGVSYAFYSDLEEEALSVRGTHLTTLVLGPIRGCDLCEQLLLLVS